MALVESHALAYQMEEFLYNLRGHILGLNLGRWDYMASLIHYNIEDPSGFCLTATPFRTTYRSSRICANCSPNSATSITLSPSAA